MKTLTRIEKRIGAAESAVDAYCRIKEVGGRRDAQALDEWIIDLLADLRHLAADREVDFDRVLWLSEVHFEAERDAGCQDCVE